MAEDVRRNATDRNSGGIPPMNKWLKTVMSLLFDLTSTHLISSSTTRVVFLKFLRKVTGVPAAVVDGKYRRAPLPARHKRWRTANWVYRCGWAVPRSHRIPRRQSTLKSMSAFGLHVETHFAFTAGVPHRKPCPLAFCAGELHTGPHVDKATNQQPYPD